MSERLDSGAAAASPISNGTGDEQGAAACDLCGRAWLEHGHVPGVGNELCPPATVEAHKLTQGPRRAKYGPPDVNHKRTALLWSAYLHARGRPAALSAEDVCWLNVLQKISRDMHEPDRDNLVDAAGYILNIEEMRAG